VAQLSRTFVTWNVCVELDSHSHNVRQPSTLREVVRLRVIEFPSVMIPTELLLEALPDRSNSHGHGVFERLFPGREDK
jgi:hypothetical protein